MTRPLQSEEAQMKITILCVIFLVTACSASPTEMSACKDTCGSNGVSFVDGNSCSCNKAPSR